MLPSMRYYLKFIDAYEKWNSHGFRIKVRLIHMRGHVAVDIPLHVTICCDSILLTNTIEWSGFQIELVTTGGL